MKPTAVPALVLLLAATLAACSGTPATPAASTPKKPAPAANEIVVTSGGAIAPKDAAITLSKEGASASPAAKRELLGAGVDLRYVAQILPVTVNGQIVQANALAISGNRAFVGYNTAGEGFGGALQVVDITDPAHPGILKEIQFANLEIDGLYVEGGTVYFTGAANPDKYGFEACIGKLDAAAPSAAAIANDLRGVRSFAATGVARYGGKLVATVGAKDGGFVTLNDFLGEESFTPRADLRDVAVGPAGLVAIGGNTDGGKQSALVGFDLTTVKETSLAGDAGAYGKETIEVNGGLAFVAASGLGVKVLDLAHGNAEVFSLANPPGATSTANAFSTDGTLAFVANGEYGFRALNLLDKAATGDGFASVAGFHALAGALYNNRTLSVNHLKYRNGSLFAAVGVGGVNVYAVTPAAAAADAAATATL